MNDKKQLRYGIIGTGAIGGYYGGRLAQAGFDVHFLFHSDYDYVVQNGLQVDSCDGSFSLPHVNAYHHAADMPKCDVVLVSLKTVNNKLLPTLLPPLLKPDTLVVLIQNGIGVEEDVQKMMPNVRLAAGVAYICVAKTQYSFSDNAKALGAPEGFRITVRDVKVSAGAGFVVVICGSIMTMPGLPKKPAAVGIDVDADGKITGLF